MQLTLVLVYLNVSRPISLKHWTGFGNPTERLKVRLAIQALLGLAWFDPELNPLDIAPAARTKEQHGKSTKQQWPSSTSNCK
jgi:hypothetical protein